MPGVCQSARIGSVYKGIVAGLRSEKHHVCWGWRANCRRKRSRRRIGNNREPNHWTASGRPAENTQVCLPTTQLRIEVPIHFIAANRPPEESHIYKLGIYGNLGGID